MKKVSEGIREDLSVWLGLVLLIVGNYLLSKLDLGFMGLPVAIAIATLEALLIMIFYMELKVQHGARRFMLPAALIFLFLLGSLTLLDNATRWPPVKPSWAKEAGVQEARPKAMTRTAKEVSNPRRDEGPQSLEQLRRREGHGGRTVEE